MAFSIYWGLGTAKVIRRARRDALTAVRIGNQLILNKRFDVRTSFLQNTERNMENARLRYELSIAAGNLKSQN